MKIEKENTTHLKSLFHQLQRLTVADGNDMKNEEMI